MLEDQSVLRVPPSTPPLKRDAAAGWADGALYTIQPSRWVSSFTETERRERRVKEGEREERRRRWKSSKREREKDVEEMIEERGAWRWRHKSEEQWDGRKQEEGRWRHGGLSALMSSSRLVSWTAELMYKEEGAETWRPLNIQMKSEERESHFLLARLTAPSMHWADDTLIFISVRTKVLYSSLPVFSTFHHRNDLIADFPSYLDPIWNQPPHVLLTAERLHLFLIFNKTASWLNVSALQTLLFIWAAPVKSADFWLWSEHASKISWFLNGVWCKVLQLLHQWLVSGEVPAPTLHFISEYTTLKKWASCALW